MRYSEDPKVDAEIRRYAFLSGFTARTDAEQAEAEALHEKYKDRTGWILHPRDLSWSQHG